MPQGSGLGVATHPVAQLSFRIIPTAKTLQQPHRPRPSRALYFHTIYDTEGNLTANPESQNFSYDAENRQTQVYNSSTQVTSNYQYDGNGKRVKKTVGNQETFFVYDAFGKLVAEYTVNHTPTQNGTQYLTADALGSPRVATNAIGGVASRHDYMPFGEEVASNIGGRTTTQGYGQADNARQKFTGYERDDESGLDFAQNRYYAGKHGRFTSVDPLAASANIKAPQTLNRYSYGNNSPYKFTDPLGLESRCVAAECSASQYDGIQDQLDRGSESERALAEHDQRLQNTNDVNRIKRAVARGDQTTAKSICSSNSEVSCNRSGTGSLGGNATQNSGKIKIEVKTLTYEVSEETTPRKGIDISLLAKISGGNYDHYNWVQTVTTSDPLDGKPANKPYADPGTKETGDFYYDPAARAAIELQATEVGGVTGFYDNPRRPYSGTTVTWHADLSLVGVKTDGSYDRLRSFSYGFSIDAKGVHLDKLVQTK